MISISGVIFQRKCLVASQLHLGIRVIGEDQTGHTQAPAQGEDFDGGLIQPDVQILLMALPGVAQAGGK